MEITVLEALMAELEPYTAAQVVCKKALIDAGLSEVANDTPYTPDCKLPLSRCLKSFWC